MSHSKTDLRHIFELQEKLMQRYRDEGCEMPEMWPLDLSQKCNQRMCRDVLLKAQEEMFEAIRSLRNTKPHRKTDIPAFDRDHFVEEVADTLHYLFEALIFAGFGPDDLADAYIAKNVINHRRIDEGY